MELEVVQNENMDFLWEDVPAVGPVNSLEKAENVINKIILKQETINEIEERAKKAIARVKDWEKEAKASISKDMHLDLEALRPWAVSETADRRVRFVDTIAGKVSFRLVKGKTTGQNLKATIEWYQKNYPEMLYEEVVFKLNVDAAKKFYEEHEEKAPTIDFEDPHDKMYVEAPK